MAYSEYPNSNFPDSVCNLANMQDVPSSLVTQMNAYKTAINNNDYTAASTILTNYPDLLKSLLNPIKINTILDEIKATQQYYKDDVEDMLTTLAQVTVGINDSATGEAKLTNAYSASKTEYLSGAVTLATNVTISTTAWDSNLEYTYTSSSVLANDKIDVYYADKSLLVAAKAFIYVKTTSVDGSFILKARKLPTASIIVDEFAIRRK